LADGTELAAPGGYADARQSQISGYYDRSDGGLAEWLGLHRHQQLRRSAPVVLYRSNRRRSPTAPAGGVGRLRPVGKPPTPLWSDRIGEMSVRQIDGKTVLSYFNASTGNMEVRVAADPTGLGAAPVTTVVFAGTWPDPAEDLPAPGTTGSRNPTAATSHRVHA
jgi:hypothetical protein